MITSISSFVSKVFSNAQQANSQNITALDYAPRSGLNLLTRILNLLKKLSLRKLLQVEETRNRLKDFTKTVTSFYNDDQSLRTSDISSEVEINSHDSSTQNISFPSRKTLNQKLLTDQSRLKFALYHALYVSQSNSIYTFIPKNACTTNRLSIALSNGVIQNFHQNNFSMNTLDFILRAKDIHQIAYPSYSFIILRCPYDRLVSAFLDKFISQNKVAVKFTCQFFKKKNIEEISFQDFIDILLNLKDQIATFDHHWRPQVEFLLYQDYDRYFSMENFSEILPVLKQDIGLEIHDSRALSKHSTVGLKREIIESAWTLNIQQLREMKNAGVLPTPKSMYSDELIQKFMQVYAQDIALYSEKCDRQKLLF
jgi:hypothetical protein